ncbi:PQQ-binding-like beta-propeller repeat protein [Streptomyces sp. NPDC002120]|uniref:outer membrane protein assembly factor BamB family protein n=1 Tax=Streptomyces sp. NPDC002120 TaxID=3364631 RepID=UPI00369B75AD
MDNHTSQGARWLPRALFVAGTAVATVTALYLVLLGRMAFVDWTRGSSRLLLLTPALGLLAYVLLARARGAARGALVRCVAATVALAALWPAWQAYEGMRGPQAYVWTWWQREKPESARPVGAWLRPSSGLVRVRTDGLNLYNSGGRSAGGLGAGGDVTFCAVSRTIPNEIGLVAAARTPDGCGGKVLAVDLKGGGKLWAKDLPVAPGRDAAEVPVAAVGETAVAVAEGALLGLDLRTGDERWRAPVPAGCRVRALDGAEDRVLYVEDCPGGGSARLLALDARTGTPAWQSPLRAAGPSAEVRMLSAKPIVLRVGGSVLMFDDAGRERGAVPVAGPQEDLTEGPAPVVSGDLLITPVKGKVPGVSAYSVLDGKRVWHAALDGATVLGLVQGRDPGGVDVVTSTAARTHLWHLDGTTGRAKAEPTILRDVPLGRRFEIYPRGPEGYTFVNLDPAGELPSYVVLAKVRGW